MSSFLEQKLIYAAQKWVDAAVDKAILPNYEYNPDNEKQVDQAKKEYEKTVKELVNDLNLTAKA